MRQLRWPQPGADHRGHYRSHELLGSVSDQSWTLLLQFPRGYFGPHGAERRQGDGAQSTSGGPVVSAESKDHRSRFLPRPVEE